MIKKLLVLSFVALFAFWLTGSASAEGHIRPSNDRTVRLPADARNGGEVIDLGRRIDISGRLLQGYLFVHYDSDKVFGRGGALARTPKHVRGRPRKNRCYSFLGNGAKWKATEDYLVDPLNNAGLDSGEVRNILSGSIDKWEDAADGKVDGIIVNIFGDEVAGTVDGVDTVAPDGKNEVMFGDIDSPGAIAATTVWGIFSGPRRGRVLVEWDQMYDDTDYDWATNGDPLAMDFDNIVTHEHGHAFGMGHPNDACTDETMYRYAGLGEIVKRDLNIGDIAGIFRLYKYK